MAVSQCVKGFQFFLILRFTGCLKCFHLLSARGSEWKGLIAKDLPTFEKQKHHENQPFKRRGSVKTCGDCVDARGDAWLSPHGNEFDVRRLCVEHGPIRYAQTRSASRDRCSSQELSQQVSDNEKKEWKKERGIFHPPDDG